MLPIGQNSGLPTLYQMPVDRYQCQVIDNRVDLQKSIRRIPMLDVQLTALDSDFMVERPFTERDSP
jgi:hypothetical protein